MRRVALLLVSLFLGAGLAGCVGGDEPAVDAAGSANVSEQAAVNESPVDDGSLEANESVGSMDHIHDYWMGAERVTLMDDEVTVDPFSGVAFTFFNTFRGTPAVGGAFLELPEGSIVFEGTGVLELTASWTDPTVTSVGVSYRSAAGNTFSEEQALVSGTPLEVQVTPEMADMPHAKSSRWMFFLSPTSAGGSMIGSFNLKVDIVKTRNPELYPGHPDLFHGESSLALLEADGRSAQTSGMSDIIGFATQSSTDDSLQSAKVVPMQTLSMTANMTITASSATVGDVADVWVEYRPADSFRYRRAQLLGVDEATGEYHFAWPVEMQQTDSPYAKDSAWRFRVRATTDPTGQGDASVRGVSDVQVDYHLVVVAYDALLDGIDPVSEQPGRG